MKNLMRSARGSAVRPVLRALAVVFVGMVADRPALAQPGPARPPAPTPAPALAAANEAPRIKLIEAGTEPRRQLRYTPAVGDTRTMTMTMKMDQKMRMGENDLPPQSMPPMSMTMEVKVEDVKPNGEIIYTLKFTRAEADRDSQLPAVQAMQKGLQAVVGMTGRAVVSSRGETKEMSFKLPAGANPMMEGLVEGMKNMVRQMSAPLPEEAVGKGAKWEAATVIKSQGVTVDQTAVMTIEEIRGNSVSMGYEVVQKAGKQVVKSPMGQMDVNSVDGAGHGSIEANLKSILPVHWELLMKAKYDMKIQEQALLMDMSTDMKMEPEPAKGAATPAEKGK